MSSEMGIVADEIENAAKAIITPVAEPVKPTVAIAADAQPSSNSQIFMALNDWLAGLGGPQAPTFVHAAAFPDEEWARFFRMFTVSTVLIGAITAAVKFAPQLFQQVGPDNRSLGVLTVFVCCAVFYSLYARIFGITISIRQSLFCFALTLTPWYPLYVLIQANGGNLGILWFVLQGYVALHVFILVVRAVRIVSGASPLRVVASLFAAIILASLAEIPNLYHLLTGNYGN